MIAQKRGQFVPLLPLLLAFSCHFRFSLRGDSHGLLVLEAQHEKRAQTRRVQKTTWRGSLKAAESASPALPRDLSIDFRRLPSPRTPIESRLPRYIRRLLSYYDSPNYIQGFGWHKQNYVQGLGWHKQNYVQIRESCNCTVLRNCSFW